MGKRKVSSTRDTAPKRSSSSSIMAEDQKRSIVASVSSSLLEVYPEDDPMVAMGVKVSMELPLGAGTFYPPDQIARTIRYTYPNVTAPVASNIALAMGKAIKKEDNEGVLGWEAAKEKYKNSSEVSFRLSHSYQSKGKYAKSSEVDPALSLQLESSQADELWGGRHKWDSCVLLKSMEDALVTLEAQICSSKNCFFDYLVVGTKQTVVGSLRPDVIIKLKGSSVLERASIGAIVTLHSKGPDSCFDNDYSVGQLITYGQEFLNKIPERLSIILGITDLREICWFRLSRCSVDNVNVALGGFEVRRSSTTTLVKESIGGYLMAEPAFLGLPMSWESDLPEGYTIKGYLGSGKTSRVYEVDRGGGDKNCCALKVLKSGYEEDSYDVRFLNELQNVDGVPRVLQCIGKSMFLIEPVGEEFGKDQVGPDISLAGLVEVLQNAHALNIVNRDIRMENLMVAESLQTGKRRLFIHDWGFAEKIDCNCASFCGSIQTASDNVLRQHIDGRRYLVYSAVDDLISLVRCIFLVLNPHSASALGEQGNNALAVLDFWAEKFEGKQLWKAAHEAAAQVSYNGLKKALQDIEHMSQSIGK